MWCEGSLPLVHGMQEVQQTHRGPRCGRCIGEPSCRPIAEPAGSSMNPQRDSLAGWLAGSAGGIAYQAAAGPTQRPPLQA